MLPLWRAKPLLAGEDRDTLGWLPLQASGLEAATEPAIYLGQDGGAPRFALDLSAWAPPTPEAPLDGFLDTTEQVHPAFPSGADFAELRACMTRLTPREAELAATARALVAWHPAPVLRLLRRCHGAAQAGWQRDCAACGAAHFPRTDPVVIMLITHGNRCWSAASPGWPQGMYSLLAGFVEPGETVEAAVRREVFGGSRH